MDLDEAHRQQDELRYRALGDAILCLRGLTALNQSPRSINAGLVADAERALSDAGIDDVALPKSRGFVRPARLFEKLAGGAAIKEMQRRRAAIEKRTGLSEPLPAPRTFDAEWCVGPAGKAVALIFILAFLISAATVFVRLLRAA